MSAQSTSNATAAAVSAARMARIAVARTSDRALSLTPAGPELTTNPSPPSSNPKFTTMDRVQFRTAVRENPFDENSAILVGANERGTVIQAGLSNRYPGMHTYGIQLDNRCGNIYPVPEVALKPTDH